MKAEHINPFLNATMNVIKTMASLEPTAGKPALKAESKTWGDVTGVIGLASETLKGNLVIGFEKKAILRIVGNMLGEEFTDINRDILEAVGEITNMVSGNAKREFSEMGYNFDMALPVIISGRDVEIMQLGKRPVLAIPFSLGEHGDFVVEASLADRK